MNLENILGSHEALDVMVKNNPIDHDRERNQRLVKLGLAGLGMVALPFLGRYAWKSLKNIGLNKDIILAALKGSSRVCGSAGVPILLGVGNGLVTWYNFVQDTYNFFQPGNVDGSVYYRNNRFTDTANMLDIAKGKEVIPVSSISDLSSGYGSPDKSFYFANGFVITGNRRKLTKVEKKTLRNAGIDWYIDNTFWQVEANLNGTKVKLVFDGTRENFRRIKNLNPEDLIYCMGDYCKHEEYIPVRKFGAAMVKQEIIL